MTGVVQACLLKVAAYVAAVAIVLATVSGCVQAIQLGTNTIGTVPVALIGTFVFGCIVTAAVMHMRRPPPPSAG